MSPMRRACLLLLSVMLAGCAARPVSPGERAFRAWVEVLASPTMEGRGVGTAGLDRARDVLADEFEKLGLEPAFAGGSYTQAVTIALPAETVRAELAWRDGAKRRALKAGEVYDFSVLGVSGAGAFAGDAVFVGYAIDAPQHRYDSLAGRADALRGKVAIALRYEPMTADGRSRWSDGPWTDAAGLARKAAWAQRHGAVALLIVNPPRKETGDSLLTTRGTSSDADVTIPVYHVRDSVIAKIVGEHTLRAWQDEADERGAPHALPHIHIEGAAEVNRRAATIHNVAAVLPGFGALKDETVVLGAHYDHLGYGEIGSAARRHAIHPGADDNASGTAAVMMLARRAVDPARRSRVRDRRTLVFACFSGEELGAHGSLHFVDHPRELAFDPHRTVAMVNFDMVGRMAGRRLTVMGAGTGDRWPAMIERANTDLQLDLAVSRAMSRRTDHVPFHQRGIATLHLFTGLHEDYHRPSDTADRINAAGGAAVVDFAEALMRQLVAGPALRFVPEPEGGYTSAP